PNNGACYTTCLAASVEPSVCDTSTACQWCSTTTSIGVCQPNAATCWATCPPATDDPLGSGVCSNSQSCMWCPAAAGGIGGIGVCQARGGTCWTSCLSATADPSSADVCGYSTECQWCPSSTSIGVCQPNSATCWDICTPASDDPLSPSLCTTSIDCKWCPTLGYCTERTRDCHTLCTTVAPDEPGICQVQSIQSQCQWCGAPGSVEYCVARTDEARLRCAASCGGLIWRQDVCNGALECHWCGVHNAAQGGRCKPLPGKSRGFVAWRREVECDTASSSETATRRLTPSSTSSASPSFTVSARLTLSLSYHDSLSFSLSNTLSITLSPSLSDNETFSRVVTVSMSRFRFTLSPKVSNTSSLSITHSKSSTSTATQQPTASRYYWRDRTLVEAVATYLAFGLMVPSVVGGMGGGAMTSSLSRVLAARNVGQCWGQSGGSVFSVPVDLCNFSSNDEDQLEGEGDAVIGAAVVLCGVVLLTSFNAAYWIWKGTSFRMASEDLSIVSVLSPLWVAAIPIVVGGAVTTAVAPMSSEHPLANTCGATAALVAVCFVLTLLLMIVLTVIPMATPALFGVACRRGKPPRNVGVTASLPKRALTWFRRSGRRWWHWEPMGVEPMGVALPNSSSHRMVRTLLLEYRALWYSALDATVVCAVSVLGTLGPFLSWTPCVATGVAVAALFVAQLLACLISQPMARPFDWYVCSITLALTLMSSLLRVVYGASTTDDEREDRGELLIIAAVFDVMVSIVTFGPIVVDAIELLKHAASCISRKQSTPSNIDEDRHVELLLLEDVRRTRAHQVDVEESCNPEGCSMDASQFVSTFELDMNGVIEEQLLEMLEENSLEPQSTVGDVVEDKLHQLITEFHQMDDDDDALLLEVVQELEPTGVATDEGSQLRATALLEAYGNND
ncbi:transmembrane protein, putative, partial [Bodo saltans]